MSLSSLFLGRRISGRTDLARRAQSALANPFAPDPAELQRFRSALQVTAKTGTVILGQIPSETGSTAWIGLKAERLLSLHGSITGGSGAGKSYLVLSCLLQVLRARRYPVVAVDMKGEFARLVTDLVLPALVAGGWSDLVQQVRVIRPFDQEFVPLLRLTEAESGVSREVQALALLTSLEESLRESFGTRMSRIVLHAVMLAIEQGKSLDVVRTWLHDRQSFARAAHTSSDALLRTYASGSLTKEQSSSFEAAGARLDEFLFDPGTRLALSAPRCLSFAEVLEGGVTVVDLGDPPAGQERLTRFWGAVILGRLTRAILARPVTEGSPRVWFVVDEVQEALGPAQAAQFSRLLSLARFKRVGVCLVNQEPGQVASIDPLLASALKTNIGYRIAFRSSPEDARALSHVLPGSRDRRGIGRKQDGLIDALTALKDRHFLFWLRDAGLRAQVLRSPRLDLDRFRALARSVPPEIREAINRGTVAIPRDEMSGAFEYEAPADEAAFLKPDGSPELESAFPTLG